MENTNKRITEALEEMFGITHENAKMAAADNGKIAIELPHFDMKFLFCPNSNTLAY